MPTDDLRGSYSYTSLATVHYGPGSIDLALPKLMNELVGKRALIVTGKSLNEKTDVVRKVENVLKSHDSYAATFTEIGEHAPVAGIQKCIDVFKNSNADIIVAVGGGSPIDASKATIYFLQQQRGGPFVKQIAIPTTLSAAEYSRGAGYKDEAGNKVSVNAPELYPSGIILDAQLTLATPERLWLSTGIRALDHAVELLYGEVFGPPMKHLCLAAIGELFTNLPLSKQNPQDVSVRQRLQLASWMSLWPTKIEKYGALGLSHSIGHKLGATYSIPHGITSCLTLAPAVHIMATEAIPQDKKWLVRALKFIDLPTSGNDEQDVHSLADAIAKLVEGLGLKSTLSDYNVPIGDASVIAKRTLGTTDAPLYPRVVKLVESLY